jgi:CHRD domain
MPGPSLKGISEPKTRWVASRVTIEESSWAPLTGLPDEDLLVPGDNFLKNVTVPLTTILAGLVVASVAVGGTGGASYKLTSTLSPNQVVPRPSVLLASGSGRFAATLQTGPRRGHISWSLRTSGLSSRGTNAFIHLGKPGKTGPVVVIICGPCQPLAHGDTYVHGKAVMRALETGGTYIDVSTKRNRKGEIRGQIKLAG